MTAVWDRDSFGGLQLASADPVAPSPGELLGESQIFLDALAAAHRLLRVRAPMVLLQGEAGTGRTLLARSLHYQGSSPQAPFIAIQCSSVPPSLLETEIFGAPAGSLAGYPQRKPGLLELAGPGTVFLDDVAELTDGVRRRLAAALKGMDEAGPLRCRIVCAAATKPETGPKDDPLVREFHDTLYENMVELPPLRSRERDMELLARHFLRRWASEHEVPMPVIESRAVQAMYAYPWPGNVRELRKTLERAAALAPGRRIGPEHLRIKIRHNAPLRPGTPPSRDLILIPPEGKSLEAIEAEAVRATLKLTGGNRSAAARILGISRPTLGRKIKKYCT